MPPSTATMSPRAHAINNASIVKLSCKCTQAQSGNIQPADFKKFTALAALGLPQAIRKRTHSAANDSPTSSKVRKIKYDGDKLPQDAITESPAASVTDPIKNTI